MLGPQLGGSVVAESLGDLRAGQRTDCRSCFRLLRRIGPVRAMSVTFLNPVVALPAGAVYLGEAITWPTVAGGAVALAGTALALGLRPAVAAAEGAR